MNARRPWLLLLASTGVAIVLLPALLLFSSLGLRLALNGSQALAPGCGFQFESIEGSLVEGAVLAGVRVETRDYTLRINRLTLKLDAAALLRRELRVPVLAGGEASLEWHDAAAVSPLVLPRLPALPFALRVDEATLASLAVIAGADTLRVTRLRTEFRWPRGAAFQLVDFSLSQGATDLTLAGQIAQGGPAPLSLETHWQHRFEDGLIAQGSGRLRGAGDLLTLEQQVVAPIQATLSASLALPAAEWQATMSIPEPQALPLAGLSSPVLASGELRAQGRGLRPGEVSVAGRVQHAAAGEWRIDGRATGAEAGDLQVQSLVLSSATQGQLSLGGVLAFAPTKGTFKGQWQDLQFPLAANATFSSARGEFELAGTVEDYHFGISADAVVPGASPLHWQASGRGTSRRLEVASLALAAGRARARFKGALEFAPVPAVELAGDWQDWTLALAKDQQVHSPRGELKLEGSLDAWRASSSVDLAWNQRRSGHVEMAASGSRAGLRLSRFEARAGAGLMTADGELDWSGDAPRWRLAAQAQDFNPGVWLPDWPGQLDFTLTSSGQPQDFTLSLAQLGGRLRGRQVKGDAEIARHDTTLKISRLHLRAGGASLDASGALGAGQTLAWTFRVPTLADLWPGATGALTADGTVSGTPGHVASQGQLSLRDLVVGEVGLARASGQWDFDLKRPGAQHVTLAAAGLRAGGWALDTFDLALHGPLAAQDLSFKAQRGVQAFSLAARGALALAPLRWSGMLTAGQWQAGPESSFDLQAPAEIKATMQAVTLARQCWAGQGRLCLDASLAPAGDWQARLSLDALALAALPEWIKGQRGELTGELSARGAGSLLAALEGQVHLGPLHFAMRDEALPPLVFGGAQLGVVTRPEGLSAVLDGAIEQPGKVPVSFTVALPPGPWPLAQLGTLPLTGRFRLDAPDLAPLAAYSEEVAELAGSAQADLGLSGSLASPVLAGDARLAIARAQLTRLGIELDDVALHLKGDVGGALALEGSARSGGGTARVHGSLALGPDGLATRLRLDSERFKVMDLPEASVLASARLQLLLEPSRASLTGEVEIPEAKLNLREGSPATERSDDVSLVDEDTARRPRTFALESDVTLRLGEKVDLEATGLHGRLAGALQVFDKERQSTRAKGELRIEDGHYTQWGQDLKLRRSRVIYSGQRLSDPEVDARAERVVEEVTAGLHVTGRLQEPRVKLYATPALSDADILSYLVAGRPLSGTSSTDAKALMEAAASLGLSQGGALTQRIAQAFGLDEIKLASSPYDTTRRNVALNVGKFLAPRLYVGYGMGLLDQASTFRLRYTLGKHWNIEAETGSRSGADLLYSIER